MHTLLTSQFPLASTLLLSRIMDVKMPGRAESAVKMGGFAVMNNRILLRTWRGNKSDSKVSGNIWCREINTYRALAPNERSLTAGHHACTPETHKHTESRCERAGSQATQDMGGGLWVLWLPQKWTLGEVRKAGKGPPPASSLGTLQLDTPACPLDLPGSPWPHQCLL